MSIGFILLGFAFVGIMFNKKGDWVAGALEGLMIPLFVVWTLFGLFLIVVLSPLMLFIGPEKFSLLTKNILPFK
ncbi:MAG: hypothetical protein AB7U43_05615 [Desulfobacter sp.]